MKILEELENNLGTKNVMVNENMSKHTTFKTGGNADFFVKVDSKEKLKTVLDISKKYNMPIFIIGNGSNILVTDSGIRGIVCKICIKKFEIEEKGSDVFVTIGSGEKLSEISQKLMSLEVQGFEFASRNTRYSRTEQLK